MIRASLILSLLCVLALANIPTSKKSNLRIIGGSLAAPGEYPFIASVRFRGVYTCGGAILGGVWIITAGFCVYGIPPNRLTVLVGTNQKNSGGVTYKVKNIFTHPEYDYVTIVNDIGLIELETPIVENNLVKPIELDTEDTDKASTVTLIGWRKNFFPFSQESQDLQYLKMQTISNEDCINALPKSATITDKQFCTLPKRGEGACQRDGSSPLINAAGRLTGLLSWVKACAKEDPEVYTKVASYITWIKERKNWQLEI